ncbi:DUF7342 family protein [Haladaptatus halobius]|uniref:DUF7342 family protein n=1 Tax=Haladaptatus halobius TaxID=2884875 RepID=UPI003F622D00
MRADLQEQIESWQNEYAVESSDELREMAAQVETAAETCELRRVANDWDIVQYRLRLIEDAIEHYSDYSGTASAPA